MIALSILGGAYWWFRYDSSPVPGSKSSDKPEVPESIGRLPPPPPPAPAISLSLPNSGSSRERRLPISRDRNNEVIDRALASGFATQFSKTKVQMTNDTAAASIKKLLDKTVDIAAISRPLSAEEIEAGLTMIPLFQMLSSSEEALLSPPRYYVYLYPPNLPVQAFLGYVTSVEGKTAIATAIETSTK